MSRGEVRHKGSRAYNLARARGLAPAEILGRALWASQRVRNTTARAVLRVMCERAESEL